jgi:hypothetical protein
MGTQGFAHPTLVFCFSEIALVIVDPALVGFGVSITVLF